MQESNWPTHNNSYSPTRQPPPSPLAWLNPVCQSVVLICALHAPVRCRLVTGYLGFTHCCCACLFICSLSWQEKAVSPPSYPFPPLSSLLTLQLNSFPHLPAAPSPTAILIPNPILLKAVIEQCCMLGLGLLLGYYHYRRNLGESMGNWNLLPLRCKKMVEESVECRVRGRRGAYS